MSKLTDLILKQIDTDAVRVDADKKKEDTNDYSEARKAFSEFFQSKVKLVSMT